ncbi:hypothetical protein, partial [Escherichia coli]
MLGPFYQHVLSVITVLLQHPELKWFTEFGHLNRGECSPQNNTGAIMKKRNFSAEFKRESAQLVVDQNYT